MTWSEFDTDDYQARRRLMDIASKLRKCKIDYLGLDEGCTNHDGWSTTQFEQYILEQYGIKYNMGDDMYGQPGIINFTVVDEQKFLLFTLRYS